MHGHWLLPTGRQDILRRRPKRLDHATPMPARDGRHLEVGGFPVQVHHDVEVGLSAEPQMAYVTRGWYWGLSQAVQCCKTSRFSCMTSQKGLLNVSGTNHLWHLSLPCSALCGIRNTPWLPLHAFRTPMGWSEHSAGCGRLSIGLCVCMGYGDRRGQWVLKYPIPPQIGTIPHLQWQEPQRFRSCGSQCGDERRWCKSYKSWAFPLLLRKAAGSAQRERRPHRGL
jgi:hypothetical protein